MMIMDNGYIKLMIDDDDDDDDGCRHDDNCRHSFDSWIIICRK